MYSCLLNFPVAFNNNLTFTNKITKKRYFDEVFKNFYFDVYNFITQNNNELQSEDDFTVINKFNENKCINKVDENKMPDELVFIRNISTGKRV